MSGSISAALQNAVNGDGGGTGLSRALASEAVRRVSVNKMALNVPPPPVKVSAAAIVNSSAVLNQITSGSVSPLQENVYGNPNVNMAGVRYRLWSRDKDGPIDQFLSAQNLSSNQIMSLTVGRYILGFKIPNEYNIPFVSFDTPIPISVLGKKVLIEKGRLDQASGRMELQINLLENPIPVLAIVLGIGGALAAGVMGFGMSDMFDSLDRVVVSAPGSMLQMGLIAGAAYLVYRYIL